ncbi:MAG: methyltransferase domain-containing protein, partial [Actinomycetes bacterium]
MPTDEQVREAQRTTWAGLSAAWEKWDAVITDQLAPVGTAMAQSLGPVGGRHLDIASGTGEPGLSIARAAPSSRVVLTDLSAEMLQVAGRRAHALGVTNVDAVACSADGLPFPDGAFGTVSVRFGYMF